MKLVCESLNEFERGMDPKDAMQIGLSADEKIKLKQKVPILKRQSPYLGKNNYNNLVYSKGYKLWKLLDYIKKAEDTGGRRYKEIVKFYYNDISRRSMSRGLFESLLRYTQHSHPNGYSNDRVRPNNRYFLNFKGEAYIKWYKEAFSKKVTESATNFTRGLEPKDAMSIGIRYQQFRDNFLEELDKLQGKDGFPWAAYYDYAYEELEEQQYLQDKVRNFMNGGLTPKQTAKLLSKYFEKGEKF